MTVVIPYHVVPNAQTEAWPLTAAKLCLKQDGVKFVCREVPQIGSYYELFSELWRKKESFIIVEHDIAAYPGAISSLGACPLPWCTFPYYCASGWIEDALGCCKFDKAFIEANPGFMLEPFPTCCVHTKQWWCLDRLVAHKMRELGVSPHVHRPGVCNLNTKM